MALNLTPIRVAIEEVLEGTIGATRTVTADTFRKGAHSGRESGAQRALALVKPRYVTVFPRIAPHEATQLSAKGSSRLDDLTVMVRFRYRLQSEVREDARTTVLDTVMNDGDVARQALAFPGNLTQTSAAVPTNILSGMLLFESFEITEEDWDSQMVVAELTGTVIVDVSQAV